MQSDLMDAMTKLGYSAEQILELVREIADLKKERARKCNAERQARFRAARNDSNAVTPVTRDIVTEPRAYKERACADGNLTVSSLRSETDISSLRSEKRAREEAETFEQFWSVWPNRVGKPAARKAWAKVWRELPQVLDGVSRYIAAKPPDRPWLNPATFLNQRRWEDQPAAVGPPAQKPSKPSWFDVARKLLDQDSQNAAEPYAGQTIELFAEPGADVRALAHARSSPH